MYLSTYQVKFMVIQFGETEIYGGVLKKAFKKQIKRLIINFLKRIKILMASETFKNSTETVQTTNQP